MKLRMPQIWSWDIATTSGWVPMANLLDNMIILRGLTSFDGHVDSQIIQLRPRAGAPSIDGAVADRSQRPVPSLALAGSPNNAFGSGTGAGNLRIENTSVDANPLRNILTSFDRSPDHLSSTFLSRRDAMNEVMNRALASLGSAMKAQVPGSEKLSANRIIAEKMIRQGIGDVSSVYRTLVLKYRGLMGKCAQAHMLRNAPGVMDRDLKKSAFAPNVATYGGITPFSDNFHDMFQYNATNPLNSSGVGGVAESFAIAEYLLCNGYSSSVVAGCHGIVGLNVPGYATWGWDEHSAGTSISLIANSFAFRCVASCLYELTQKLTEAKVFDETLIQLGGEFSRSPRVDQLGADHSPDGNVISLISGAIRSPCVIGNTKPSTDPAHPGNYGIGDTMNIDGGNRQPGTGQQSSTIAQILRVAPPVPNDSSLLTEGSGGITAAVELAKNRGETG
ncbi:MAG: DUF1501 domain-containing protein [Verrucomicrobiaceae bacterium]|nr:MAG: DUF1501 domain-containing protein [Verrucomicrobiaceae bacterium]